MSTTSDTPPRTGGGLKLVNRAGESRSPYVRGHGKNPVAWQLWSPETLQLAKQHDRLVFLSVGYAACHWCHVMERESFENNEVASLINASFIPIKLDREERPDIDQIYMNYVQATTGSGGWPLNVFLTPSLEPLFGGTYWPGPDSPTAHRDQVDFVSILKRLETVWREQRQRCLNSAGEITKQLREFSQEGFVSRDGVKEDEGDVLELELLDDAYEHFNLKYDRQFAGFGAQPKFPTPMNLHFLLSLSQYPQAVRDIVGEDDVANAKTMVLATLKAMWKGGIKDQVGYGFARYSVTRDWSLPHFEKMLYDQVQLLPLYLDAYLITKDQIHLDAVLDLVNYLTSPPIAAPNGGFHASEDADSLARPNDTEKREGAFYVWTLKELMNVLGNRDGEICAKYWTVQENGNVEREFDIHDELLNQNVLAVSSSHDTIAKQYNLNAEELHRLIQNSRQKLREYRDKERPRPMLDDKIVLSWNGLAIGALARTATALEKVKSDISKRCLDSALKAATFVKKEMYDESSRTMKRVWREGLGDAPAFAGDYAFLIGGLIDLYEATWDEKWLEWADSLQKTQIKLFWDSSHGGFFTTASSQTDLILRLKDGLDNAEPSANGFSARNLNRLGSLLEDEDYTAQAKRTLHAFEAEILQHPFLFAGMMDAIVIERLGIKSIVVTGEGSKVDKYLDNLREQTAWGRTVVRLSGRNEWLKKRNTLLSTMNVEKEGVFVCENHACREVTE